MREKLIDIIARCQSVDYKHEWIYELMTKTDIECTESQCTNCPIQTDCIEVSETYLNKEVF